MLYLHVRKNQHMKTLTIFAALLFAFSALGIPPGVTINPPEQPPAPTLTATQQDALRQALQLPPGTRIDVEVENVQGGRATLNESGTGVGAGAFSKGDKLSDKLDGSAPSVGLGGGRLATGGGIERTASASAVIVPSESGKLMIILVGVLLVIGAGVCFWLKLTEPALILGLIGVGLIATAFYPALLLWVLLGVVLVVAGPYIWAKFQALTHKEALRAVVAGVDSPSVPPDAAAAVKAAIGGQATQQDKATISAIKSQDGITSAPAPSGVESALADLKALIASMKPVPQAAPPSVVVLPAPTNTSTTYARGNG